MQPQLDQTHFIQTTEILWMNAIDEKDAEVTEEVSLSIEETNKLRISLGLKPLKVEAEDSGQKTAEDNFAEYQAKLKREQEERQKIDLAEK